MRPNRLHVGSNFFPGCEENGQVHNDLRTSCHTASATTIESNASGKKTARVSLCRSSSSEDDAVFQDLTSIAAQKQVATDDDSSNGSSSRSSGSDDDSEYECDWSLSPREVSPPDEEMEEPKQQQDDDDEEEDSSALPNPAKPKARRRRKARITKYKAGPKESAIALVSSSKVALAANSKKEGTQKSNLSVGPKKKGETQTWDETYEQLVDFYRKNGHCNVNYGENPHLGRWVTIQKGRNRAKLTEEQVQKLNAIDFNWNKAGARFDKQWDDNFNQLVEYKETYGKLHVPFRTEDDEATKALSTWCTNQRQAYSKHLLKEGRKERLESIGFLWVIDEGKQWGENHRNYSAQQKEWEKVYDELVEFHAEHGHCLVPFHREKGKKGEVDTLYSLSRWVRSQRTAHREKRLNKARKKKLDELGFAWKIDKKRSIDKKSSAELSLHQRQWEDKLGRLVAFKARTGHTRVPRSYEDRELGNWVRHQRYKNRRGTMLESRAERLRQIGFEGGKRK